MFPHISVLTKGPNFYYFQTSNNYVLEILSFLTKAASCYNEHPRAIRSVGLFRPKALQVVLIANMESLPTLNYSSI